jgi:hypothetical protein
VNEHAHRDDGRARTALAAGVIRAARGAARNVLRAAFAVLIATAILLGWLPTPTHAHGPAAGGVLPNALPDTVGAFGHGQVAGALATRRDVALATPPLLPPSPINPDLLKEIFRKLALEILGDIEAALRAPLDAWLASPLNFVSQTPPAGTYESTVVAGLWGVVRGAANAMLALVIVVAGLNVLLKDRLGAPYHEAAEVIPRAAAGAALANISLALAAMAIDFNNALCSLIGGASLPGWQQASPDLQNVASVVAGLLYLVTALFLILQMLMRLALIDVLIVVAPLALLCWVLPQTQGWARRWSSAFGGAVFTQFVQIVALKLGAEIFTDLTPATGGAALLPSLLGIAVLVLTIRIPALLRGHDGGGGGLVRLLVLQQLRRR